MNITGQRLRAFNQDHALDAIEIIDLFNEDGTPAGTRVHFRIRRKFIGDLHKVKVD